MSFCTFQRIEIHFYWEILDDTANGDNTKHVISVAENRTIKVSTNDKFYVQVGRIKIPNFDRSIKINFLLSLFGRDILD